MLKAVSSITNAIGALNYKGTWNASTNTPTLASGVGTKGDYYVVSVAGSTTLDGISNWGVGDWAAYNGSVWQRVEGGADGNFVNLSVSSTSTLSGLTASTALALDASKNVVSVTNTGTGSNVLATTPTLSGDVNLSTGNLVIGTANKGIDFSVVVHSGSTSKILDDYEIGNWTPTDGSAAALSFSSANGKYTKIGRAVFVEFRVTYPATVSVSNAVIANLPFTNNNNDRDNVPVTILSDGTAVSGMFNQGGTDFGISTIGTFTSTTNATLSTITLRGSGWYVVAV